MSTSLRCATDRYASTPATSVRTGQARIFGGGEQSIGNPPSSFELDSIFLGAR